MFLRVLIHLTMHDYPPLISGSLQLLFKHFSQRQEVLHTFKQVTLPWGTSEPTAGCGYRTWDGPWPLALGGMSGRGGEGGLCPKLEPLGMLLQVQLLISAQDVENYKVIKSELDKLRTMVEKSELWVDKKGSSKGDSAVEGNKKEKKEVRALSKTLGGRAAASVQLHGLCPLSLGGSGGPVGWGCAPGSAELRWDSDTVSVPLQLAADEEVIAPGEKSSENYQIVKGVSETKSRPQGCAAGRAGSSWAPGTHICMASKPQHRWPSQRAPRLGPLCQGPSVPRSWSG